MTQTTATIATFIRDRLTEMERGAHDAVDVGWVTFRQPDGSMGHTALGTPTEEGWLVDGRLVQDERAEVFYDPARVLAQVAAMRLIAEDHDEYDAEGYPGYCGSCGDVPQTEFPCRTLRALASIWADDPGFQEAWR